MRPPALQSASEALEALREAWIEVEPKLIAAAWSSETPDLEVPKPPYLAGPVVVLVGGG